MSARLIILLPLSHPNVRPKTGEPEQKRRSSSFNLYLPTASCLVSSTFIHPASCYPRRRKRAQTNSHFGLFYLRPITTGHAAMPSFLSKVFGRKKSEDRDSATPRSARRSSDPSLLEGKFEAIPSNLSPSSPKSLEDVHASEKGKDKEGDKGRQFGLLKSKSKPQQPSSPTTDAPHLTLRLPGTTEKNGDSFVASFNPQADESDNSILTRRLTPEETLSLIEACSKAITERGGMCQIIAFAVIATD